MSHSIKVPAKSAHPGLRLRSPARYDWIVWLFSLGRPRRFRQLMLRPARLRRGEAVLDVSCGTGSLALLAKSQVGPEGKVHGIDASDEMIAYAREKASRAGVDVGFDVAPAQQLPFAESSFDVILNTLALHHLPKPSRYQAMGEMRRVLKPGGRVLIEDFAEGRHQARGLFAGIKNRHGSVPPEEIAAAMRAAGFEIAETGPVGAKSLHFVLARAPGAPEREFERGPAEAKPIPITNSHRALFPLGATALVLVVLAHTAVGAAMVRGVDGFNWKTIGAIAAVLLAVKIGSHLLLARIGWHKGLRRQD